MCCTLEPSEVEKTIVVCIEAKHPETNRVVHVAGYQNKAKADGPNAMLLPFPTTSPMNAGNVIDTRQCTQILKDYAESVVVAAYAVNFSGAEAEHDDSRGVQVFESGSYTVILCADAAAIPSALQRVPIDKRPEVNQAIFDRYAELYPASNWQFALCCWNGAVDAEPMLWWYTPSDPTTLFLPGLDAHDGRPPVLDATVAVDHVLVVGSNIRVVQNSQRVYFSDRIPEAVKPFVSTHVAGAEFRRIEVDGTVFDEGRLVNGDWHFAVDDFAKLDATEDNQRFFKRVSPLHA